MQKKADHIVAELSAYFKKVGISKAVVGLSGGVDSALTAKLGVMALGKENVTALILPNEGVNKPQNVQDAVDWARELGIQSHVILINPFIDAYEKLPWRSSSLAKMNIQARVRMTLLYHYANTHNAIVLGTGNKTELMLGYFTKHGDGATDILPIGNLYKTDVWKMSEYLGLPEIIVHKTASAELMRDQSDEEEIGLQYAEIDSILKKFEAGKKPSTEDEQKLFDRMKANEHKNEGPPVITFDN
ncbi:NAD+ synthase [Candidatus Peregrinibacteria bacterium]|nr:NAD+ synthase [Candidatus Peregrinibacteria bacterium]